ncbi:MAG: hypothetical protein D6730_24670 [Bacteroidetes bacterium]|nr:MAG: hypothetical protein D6730_24670 [Bacteroidota bacterium]
MRNRNTRLIILIIMGLMLLTVMGFMVIRFVASEGQKEKDEELISQLTQQLEEVNSNMIEISVLFDEKDMQVEEAERLLVQKLEQINYMEKELDRLRREGKISKERIRQLELELENARNKLRLKQRELELKREQQKNEELTALLDSLSDGVSIEQFQQIQKENERLQEEVDRYRGRVGELEEVSKSVLSLRAGDFYFNNVRGGTREKGLEFEAKSLDRIEVCFTVFKNSLTEPGPKELYLIIQRPDGKIMDNLAGYSQQVRIKGSLRIVSAYTSIEYNRQDTPVCIDFKPGASQEFLPGRNVVQIYCNGELIGNTILNLN